MKAPLKQHRPAHVRYAIALLATLAAALLRALLDPMLGNSAPLFLNVAAVAISVWTAGLIPAVMAALVGYAISAYLFFPTRGHFVFDERNVVMLVTYCFTATIVIWFGILARASQKKQVQEARRRSEELLEQELADTKLLGEISGELVRQDRAESLYNRILEAAKDIMRSDFASMQMVMDGGGKPELLLLASQGFPAEAKRHWKIVGIASGSTCGYALRTGRRTIVPDVQRCLFPLAAEDLELYARMGIRSTQTTPLVSRGGEIVGMISTHWHGVHEPSERDLRLMDILSRQAADLIDRVQVVQQLKESARLLDLSNDAIIVLDPEGRIIYWNHGSEEVYGYTREQAVGQKTAELLRAIYPEPLEEIRQKLERDGRWSGEIIHHRSDGRPVQVMSRWALDRDTDGRPASILETNNDITDRRAADEALRLRTAQHETLLRQAPIGVFLVDADFRIREVNPIALPAFGDVPGGVVGKNFEDVTRQAWNPEYADEVVRIFRHTLATGESFHAPEIAEFRRDRGVTEYYEWRLDRIMLPEGRYGLVCYFRDISKEVQTRHSIEESDRRKDEFLAVLAHELRNPLSPVRNAAHYLKMKNLADPELKRPVEMIERQVTHMARLIDDLLDTSRIARGILELRIEPVPLVEIVEAAVEANRDEIDSRGHALRVSLPKRSLVVDVDRHRLVQVIGNLISNAAKYTPVGGQIDLEARAEDGTLRVSVKDNGVGIPASHLSVIFELFAQLDRSLERQGGLGIGLTLARQLIELHGGTIEAHSEGIGHGSTFVVTLPIAAQKGMAPKQPLAENGGMAEPRRILVADDNKDAADSMALLLQSDGHLVRVALDGQEALRAAEDFLPEIALLDIGMPHLNGYEVAKRIRSHPWGRSMRLVAITGWGQERDRQRAEEAGFDAHLVKPVQPAKLRELLENGGARK